MGDHENTPRIAPGLTLELVYSDADLLEIVVTASSGAFSGAASFYSSSADLDDAADALSGFPARAGDTREVRLGAPDRGRAGGSVALRFSVTDSAGHAFVVADVESGDEHGGTYQKATVAIPVEAAGVDRFVAELRALAQARGGRAFLRKAD
ncbi:hypothetical protein [Sorangium sp. So ce861]|uniref:hypothetical protein n=1 Tax=Sorangium sp. So ce861 TaxID=3133323 RepID=UPI003F5E4D31